MESYFQSLQPCIANVDATNAVSLSPTSVQNTLNVLNESCKTDGYWSASTAMSSSIMPLTKVRTGWGPDDSPPSEVASAQTKDQQVRLEWTCWKVLRPSEALSPTKPSPKDSEP